MGCLSLLRVAFLLLALGASSLALCHESRQDASGGPEVQSFLEHTEAFSKKARALGRQLAKTRQRVEDAREECRQRERASRRAAPTKASPSWRRDWEQVARLRKTLHSRFQKLLGPWYAELSRLVRPRDGLGSVPEPGSEPVPERGSEQGHGQRNAVAESCLAVLDEWISIGEPDEVLETLREKYSAFSTALGGLGNPVLRREFLQRITERLFGTPGLSDVDVLVGVVEWEVLLLGGESATLLPFDALTADLILLFTDRKPDAISPSDRAYSRAGRFTDWGFKPSLQDGSDQVGHFCWALRVLVVAGTLDQAEQLLRYKELRDAAQRDLPLNQSDLLLNHAAREIVEQIRLESTPIDQWPALLRKKLAR